VLREWMIKEHLRERSGFIKPVLPVPDDRGRPCQSTTPEDEVRS